ncbi:MAG: sigma-70 family RNA polymerase sigma factor [Devosia sp.]|nr:sigma-70 family RNA polymerase sigma factor [Devosia sp.]
MNDMVRLIEPMIPALRRYARALLRDRSAADDLVQDCLERAVGRWHQRRADGDPRAWIFTILHNLATSHHRRLSVRPAHETLEATDESAFALAPAQEQAMQYRELLAAVARLPEDQRSVLLLVSVEQLSYSEAANVLDVPIGTVMSRLSRARERLARELSDDARRDGARPQLRRVK